MKIEVIKSKGTVLLRCKNTVFEQLWVFFAAGVGLAMPAVLWFQEEYAWYLVALLGALSWTGAYKILRIGLRPGEAEFRVGDRVSWSRHGTQCELLMHEVDGVVVRTYDGKSRAGAPMYYLELSVRAAGATRVLLDPFFDSDEERGKSARKVTRVLEQSGLHVTAHVSPPDGLG